jgi:hypothetical protein
MSTLVSLQEISRVLRRSEKEIMGLVGERRIPYNTTHEGIYIFPLEQVLSQISPLEVTAPVDPVVAPEAPPVEVGEPTHKPSEKKPVVSPKKGRKRG